MAGVSSCRARRGLVIAAAAVVAVGLSACAPDDEPSVSDSSSPPTSVLTESPTTRALESASEQPPTTTKAEAWPPFAAEVEPVTTERLGDTWEPGCPVGADELRLVSITHATFDGGATTGELIIAAELVDDVVGAFEEIYASRFPIRRMITIDAYGGDDDNSMADDNTSAFNCRAVTGGTGFSRHAYGVAIDINPLENPYVSGDVVLPPAGREYLDRTDLRPGMIVDDDVVVRAFTSRGFEWGGAWTTLKDYQHVADLG